VLSTFRGCCTIWPKDVLRFFLGDEDDDCGVLCDWLFGVGDFETFDCAKEGDGNALDFRGEDDLRRGEARTGEDSTAAATVEFVAVVSSEVSEDVVDEVLLSFVSFSDEKPNSELIAVDM